MIPFKPIMLEFSRHSKFQILRKYLVNIFSNMMVDFNRIPVTSVGDKRAESKNVEWIITSPRLQVFRSRKILQQK